MVPCCAFSATALVSCVLTTMSCDTVLVQAVSGLRCPSTSTMHWRQAPTGSSNGWSQNRGIWMPSSSAARMMSVPLGTATSTSSMVRVTRSSGGGPAGPSLPAPSRRSGARVMSVRSRGGGGGAGRAVVPTTQVVVVGRRERAAAEGVVVDELVPEELDARDDRAGRAVAQGAERTTEDVVAGVEQRLDVLLGADAGLQPLQDLDHPVGPLAARGALAAGLVRVELREPQARLDHADGVVHDHQGGGAEQGAGRLHAFEVQRGVEVLLGE